MSLVAYLPAVISGSQLHVDDLHLYRQTLKANEGLDVIVQIIPVGSASLKAFYYKVVLGIVSEHTGYTKKEANAEMKGRFIPRELVADASIADMTNREISDLIRDIQEFAIRGGLRADRKAIYIPDPNEAVTWAG